MKVTNKKLESVLNDGYYESVEEGGVHTLRQNRFKSLWERGINHPWDICAVGTHEQLVEMSKLLKSPITWMEEEISK